MMAEEDELDALAGEYVLGTLSGDERAAVERRMLDHPDLAGAVDAWHERLMPLAAGLAPVTPRPEVWQRIRRTVADREPVVRSSWWNRVGVWRGLAALATATAAAVVALVLSTSPPQLIAVLNDAQGRPVWLLRTAEDERGLLTRLLGDAPPAERVPELWLLPSDRPPVSLGLLEPIGDNRRPLAPDVQRLLRAGAMLAVSLEPPGGSPSGQPTGPVVSTGKLAADPR
jgi:anti-sigma-K factor RskA